MNLLQKGFRYLTNALLGSAAIQVVVKREGKPVFIGPAVLGKSRFYDVDYTERTSLVYSSDFIFSTEAEYMPKIADVIEVDDCGKIEKYVVRPNANEFWTYDDPYKSSIRVHTQKLAK